MGIRCGSQVTLCEYPVGFDTYSGCSHGCRYCFAQTKVNLDEIRVDNSAKALRNFISGKRTQVTNWCDWAIPLHWGGVSDPFQPAERRGGASLECLKILAETGYPVIISTKGKLLTEEPYLSILRRCNAVVQVSMVCSTYDKLEPGAPPFEERLKMLERLAGSCKRVVVRAQPYITSIKAEFLANVPRMADAGAGAVTVEGMKFKSGKPGLVKQGGDFCYPEALLEAHYGEIRDACHESGLKFFCAENRLRGMGDGTACCGCGDLPGFAGNPFNVVSCANGSKAAPTERMRKKGTAECFKALHQDKPSCLALKKRSFAEQMAIEADSMQKSYLAHTEAETLPTRSQARAWVRTTCASPPAVR